MASMKQITSGDKLGGILLILLGIVLLNKGLNLLPNLEDFLMGGGLGIGAMMSFRYYQRHPQKWWVLIPGGLLFGLAGLFIIDAIPLLDRHFDEDSFFLITLAFTFWVIYTTQPRRKWPLILAGLIGFVAVITSLNNPDFFLGLIFVGGGVLAFQYYFSNRHHWWLLIPGAALLGVSGILITNGIGWFGDYFNGSIMLLALSLGFWVIYIREEKHWWAVLPAGVLTTLGFMVTLSSLVQIDFQASFLLLGLGATFDLLWLRRHSDGTGWAIWPGAILSGIGLLIPIIPYAGSLIPLALIGAGGWLLTRNLLQNYQRGLVFCQQSNEG